MIKRKRTFKKSPELFFQNKSAEHNGDIILSGSLSNRNENSKCIQIINGVTNERQDLDNHIEEAYMRIISHIAKSVESGLEK